MKKDSIEYTYLIDIAKINLANKMNIKIEQYKAKKDNKLKEEIINLIKDRQQLFMFNTKVIEKYL